MKRNGKTMFLAALIAGMGSAAQAFDTPQDAQPIQAQVRTILEGNGPEALPEAAGRPAGTAERGQERMQRWIRCTAKTLHDGMNSRNVDLALLARVVSDQLLQDVSMTNAGRPLIQSALVTADATYKPKKAGRKDLNRFFLGHPADGSFGTVFVYLPKRMTMTSAPRGEIETKETDGGWVGSLACAWQPY